MEQAPDDRARVAALRSYGMLDTPNEAAFDAIVREAAHLLDAPMALISLIDEHRQWFKAKVGIEPAETPRSISFCTHAIRGAGVLVVEDCSKDERFADNPFVAGEPGIRFYAGAPLKTPSGMRIGTICALDTRVHPETSDRQRARLEALAGRTMQAMEARRARLTAAKS